MVRARNQVKAVETGLAGVSFPLVRAIPRSLRRDAIRVTRMSLHGYTATEQERWSRGSQTTRSSPAQQTTLNLPCPSLPKRQPPSLKRAPKRFPGDLESCRLPRLENR